MNMVSDEHSMRWTAYCDEQSKRWTVWIRMKSMRNVTKVSVVITIMPSNQLNITTATNSTEKKIRKIISTSNKIFITASFSLEFWSGWWLCSSNNCLSSTKILLIEITVKIILIIIKNDLLLLWVLIWSVFIFHTFSRYFFTI